MEEKEYSGKDEGFGEGFFPLSLSLSVGELGLGREGRRERERPAN